MVHVVGRKLTVHFALFSVRDPPEGLVEVRVVSSGWLWGPFRVVSSRSKTVVAVPCRPCRAVRRWRIAVFATQRRSCFW